jgi:dihydroorotate dehydrogenase
LWGSRNQVEIYPFFRSLLFRLEPEKAHALTLHLIRLVGDIAPLRTFFSRQFTVQPKQVQAFGLAFRNPVGLAGGYDKDGLGWRGLACLGFGHVEIGTVTPLAQEGNPKPRVFRLVEDQALINRMGFPGRGAEFVTRQLAKSRPPGLIIGVNLGKNMNTPLEEAEKDYLKLMRGFVGLGDYLAINVSSPNTVGLRRLQAREELENLLAALAQERRALLLDQRIQKPIPLLVKIAPDLSSEELDDALKAILDNGIDGIIATNTTLQRHGLVSSLAREMGGLSGAPLFSRSLEMVSQISQRTQGRLPIIGVGGIASASSARAMLDAGATLVQVYSGLIYSGPGLVKQILSGL